MKQGDTGSDDDDEEEEDAEDDVRPTCQTFDEGLVDLARNEMKEN